MTESTTTPKGGWMYKAIWVLIIYYLVSIVTLPALNAIWYGELPLLAVIQLPKVEPARYLRTHVVMPLIQDLGLSRGSYSPDLTLASPLALAIVCLVPMLLLLAYLLCQRGFFRRHIRLVAAVAVLAIIDFGWTLMFASPAHGGLSIY
jgi:hypothetical protein